MRPGTQAGRLALWFFAAFVTLMILFFAAISVGERGGDQFFDNLRLTLPILGAWFAAVGAMVAGLRAVVRHRERSVVVFGVTAVGVLVFLFGVLEVLFPH